MRVVNRPIQSNVSLLLPDIWLVHTFCQEHMNLNVWRAVNSSVSFLNHFYISWRSIINDSAVIWHPVRVSYLTFDLHAASDVIALLVRRSLSHSKGLLHSFDGWLKGQRSLELNSSISWSQRLLQKEQFQSDFWTLQRSDKLYWSRAGELKEKAAIFYIFITVNKPAMYWSALQVLWNIFFL